MPTPHPEPVIAQPPSSALRTSGRFAPLPTTQPAAQLELSVVMPCVGMADALRACITRARRALDAAGISGEIIVADSGSTDGSLLLAESLGARVVRGVSGGYGGALMAGIAAARGHFVLFGDADGRYDFGELPRFVARLHEGYDLVLGCRLPAGGGTIQPGAMPTLHSRVGHPLLGWMVRRRFSVPIRDAQCGMRALSRALYDRLDQRCTGTEFIAENLIKANIHGARIAEVPVTLHSVARGASAPRPSAFHDAWRNLCVYLMYSPRWFFLLPGIVLVTLGAIGYGLSIPRLTVRGTTFDVATLLFASLSLLAGYQAILFAAFARAFAISEGLLERGGRMERLSARIGPMRALLLGAAALAAGIVLLSGAAHEWYGRPVPGMRDPSALRVAVAGFTLTSLGLQTVLASFLLSLLSLRRR